MYIRNIIYKLLQSGVGYRIVNGKQIIKCTMLRHSLLHFIYHNLHGTAQLITVITIVTVDKKCNGGYTNNQKRNDTNKNNGAVYLSSDVHLKYFPESGHTQPS
ncbi:MAG: hypothetical protein BWZ05_01727 [Bacteroidetes bacterium ADurb.BinA245]|nr:MAG: hypothetical protein BWZ05_01727 [Bacteroidetes bacterium ADurb.BinA245]